MNSLVVYFSKFGNTREIAEEIAEILQSTGDARTIPLDQLSVSDFQKADLVLIGVPTHQMNLPDEVKVKLKSFPKRTMHHIPFAAFDTSYKMSKRMIFYMAGLFEPIISVT